MKNLAVKDIADAEEEEDKETLGRIVAVLQGMGIAIEKDKDIEGARRIGPYTISRTRAILAKYTLIRTKKMKVLGNTKNVKGTDIRRLPQETI